MSSPPKSQSARLFGSSSRRDPNEYTSLFPATNNRLSIPIGIQQPELDDSKMEFLEKQTLSQQRSFNKWQKISILGNLFTLICVILVLVFCFYWITKIDQTEIICVNLKTDIVWVIVAYIIGGFGNILGLIAGCIKSIIGFVIYQVLIAVLIALRIILDTSAINMAIQYLEGCSGTKTTISISDYIYGTMFYCLLLFLLFACNFYIIYLIWKLRQAQKVQRNYNSAGNV